MANLGKWTSTTLTTVMSTELNSLASNSGVSSASAYDNSTNLDMYVDIEVFLAAFSPNNSLGPQLLITFGESVDGTNFPAANNSHGDFELVTTLPIGKTASTAQRVVVKNVIIPPAKFLVNLFNLTGSALAASGNTVKFITYKENTNG